MGGLARRPARLELRNCAERVCAQEAASQGPLASMQGSAVIGSGASTHGRETPLLPAASSEPPRRHWNTLHPSSQPKTLTSPSTHLDKVCWAGHQDRQCSRCHPCGDLDVQSGHVAGRGVAAHESALQRIVHPYPQATVQDLPVQTCNSAALGEQLPGCH